MSNTAQKLHGQRTLVVEDDDDLRRALKIYLEWAGCNVIDVADGSQAYAILQKSSFDLAIVDMIIPNGHGKDILNMAKHHGTTLIAITGDPLFEAKDVYERGAHVLVRKPFELEDVVQAAVRHLRDKVAHSKRVHLSGREFEILGLINKGFETEQIAAILRIKPNTVWHHRKSLKRKHLHMSFIEICALYFKT